ncbi:MAG: hypothetical protein AB8E82_17840 [Aureispira sp.]
MKITSILHWWITFSYMHTSALVEGGEQIASIMTLAFIPLLHKGKKVLIGTQKEQELYALLSDLVETEQLTKLRETETVQKWLKGNR